MLASRTSSRHIASLDSLRALAACSVAICHALMLIPQVIGNGLLATLMTWWPVKLVWAANEAVLIFFVLSGYVLSLQFWEGRNKSYLSFMITRWFRLYPAYIVMAAFVVLLSTAIIHFYGAETVRWCSRLPWHDLYGRCGTQDWRHPVSADIVQSLLMYAPTPTWINPVTWTLEVEIQVSIIFPALIYLMRVCGWLSLPASILAAYLIAKALTFLIPADALGWFSPIMVGLRYVWCFVLGAELCRRRELIASLTHAVPPWRQWFTLALGTDILCGGWPFSLMPELQLEFVGIGAAIILIAAAYFPSVRSAFEVTALRWMGERSYSLYLVHVPILDLLVMTMWPTIPIWAYWAMLLPLSLIAAHGLYLFVERPGIAIGRFAAGRRNAILASAANV